MARFVALLLAIVALLPVRVAVSFATVTEASADCCNQTCPKDAMPGHHAAPARPMGCCKIAPQPPPVQATFAKPNPGQEMRAASFSSATHAVAQCAGAAPMVRASAPSPPAIALHQLCSLQI